MMTNSPLDPRTSPQSPLIDGYLNHLASALRDADPADRDEVLATVHEHIATSLAEKPEPITNQDIESVLAALGPVEQVAGDVERAAWPVPMGWPGPLAAGQPPRWPRWYATALLIMGLLSIPLIVFQPPLAILLALLALTLGVAGSIVHAKPHKTAYRWAAVLGGFTLTMVFVFLFSFVATTTGPTEIEVTAETSVASPS